MSRLHKLIASTAIGLGLALTATVASAVNPIINGNFKQIADPPGNDYSKVVGWTSNLYKHPSRTMYAPSQIFFTSDVYDVVPRPDLPITHHGRFDCVTNCAKGYTNSTSQMITGLEQNKTYTISFYIQGWAWKYYFSGIQEYPPVPPFLVSLGSQTSTILLPANTTAWGGYEVYAPWLKKSVTFTYTDPGSSALLTFTQNFSGELHPAGVPTLMTSITKAEDRIFLSMIGDGIVEEPSQGPTLSVQKALNGNRGANTDQFTVQILDGVKVVNVTTKSTTTGNNATVDNGTGTTGATTLTAGTSYKIAEVGSGNTNLGGYSSTLACINSTGTKVPTALNTAFTLSNTDTVSCTITNKVLPVTLALRQLVQKPVPINIGAPYTFSYTGTNGWTTQPVTNDSQATLASGPTQTLSAFNTATTLSAIMPARWSVATFSCVDINAAASGNPPGELVKVLKLNTITIPAANVRPGANLRCTSMLSRLTP